MNGRLTNKILTLVFVALLIATGQAYGGVDEIRLYIPSFQGPGDLGRNVATVLNLQIWRTLRREPWPNPQSLDFGGGLIVWGPNPLDESSHREAERKAMEDHIWAQMTLWGEAFSYGDGVITQTYLSIPAFEDYRENKFEIWRITVPTPKGGIQLQMGPPRRRYEFAPIVLSNDVVERYSLPSSLKMFREPRKSEVIGEVGNEYTGIEPRGNYQFVYSEGKRGWVYLPRLSKERNEVVDFVGGVIRIFRSDWTGATTLMDRVINNPSSPTALRIDALLYKAYSQEQRGRDGEKELRIAYALNPYSRTTLKYWVMSRFARLIRNREIESFPDRSPAGIREIQELVKAHTYLFSKKDTWLAQVLTAVESLQQKNQ